MQMAFQILLNFSIAVVWMLLNTSFKASTFIIGYLIGMMAIVIMRRYFKEKLYLYRICAVISLILLFFMDLILSYIVVLNLMLRPNVNIKLRVYAYHMVFYN